jgi:methionyl-tRNA synthetase
MWRMAILSLLSGSFRSASAWTAPCRSLVGRGITRGSGCCTASSFSYTRLSTAAQAAAPSPMGTPATSFDDGVSPFEITTPIYYVNDKPHIGHAYTSTACDVIARFMRLSGRDVFFLSGTDEHGQKVEQSAAAKNVEPQAFVDDVSQNFRDMLKLLNISNDKFIRTTQEDHKKSVQVR